MQANLALNEFCTDLTLKRFLAARSWDVAHAKKMLLNTLEWRKTYKPHEIRWDDIAKEATGKLFVMPRTDKHGRTVVILRPREERAASNEEKLRMFVYTMEVASKRADASGQIKMAWLVDFEGYTMRNAPSIRVSLNTMQILQAHYPERLGLALCYHPPTLFSFTWKAVLPFLDPVTANKVVFVGKGKGEAAIMAEQFHMEDMEACLGGRGAWAFQKEQYRKFCCDVEAQPRPVSTPSS